MLKLKFQSLHVTVVNSVNAADIIDFLFQEKVIGAQEMRTLQLQRNDPQQQCRDLLSILHTSENPQAFIHLYSAIKEESHLHRLIDRIDKYSDRSLQYISNQTGKCHSEGFQSPAIVLLCKQCFAAYFAGARPLGERWVRRFVPHPLVSRNNSGIHTKNDEKLLGTPARIHYLIVLSSW